MTLIKMSMHRLLGMLKANEAIIQNGNGKQFVYLYKKSQGKVSGIPANDVAKDIKAEYQSIQKLIKNNHILRSARVASNAVTKVLISGKEYTVADAIARKQNLTFEKAILNTLIAQYARVKRDYDAAHEKLVLATSNHISGLVSDKSAISAEKVTQMEKDYRELHEQEILDPIGIAEEIKKLEKDIREFEMEVDYVLSDSNATTYVEVELND